VFVLCLLKLVNRESEFELQQTFRNGELSSLSRPDLGYIAILRFREKLSNGVNYCCSVDFIIAMIICCCRCCNQTAESHVLRSSTEKFQFIHRAIILYGEEKHTFCFRNMGDELGKTLVVSSGLPKSC